MSSELGVRSYSKAIELSTSKDIEFIDITERVKRLVKESGIKNGLVNLFTKHTTTAVRVNEKCDCLQKDMEELFAKIAPKDKSYKHNTKTIDGRENARSHLIALLVGGTAVIPVKDGSLDIGDWQSVFFIECDGPRDLRTINVTAIGE